MPSTIYFLRRSPLPSSFRNPFHFLSETKQSSYRSSRSHFEKIRGCSSVAGSAHFEIHLSSSVWRFGLLFLHLPYLPYRHTPLPSHVFSDWQQTFSTGLRIPHPAGTHAVPDPYRKKLPVREPFSQPSAALSSEASRPPFPCSFSFFQTFFIAPPQKR